MQKTIAIVTIQLRPYSTITSDGYLQIDAPSGFLLQTMCTATIHVHVTEMPSLTHGSPEELSDRITWAEFSFRGEDKFLCLGEENPSNKAKIQLIGDRRMKAGVLYVITLQVENPLSVNQANDWRFQSYATQTLSSSLDTSFVRGFPINYLAQVFRYDPPETQNGGFTLPLRFQVAFYKAVGNGETVALKAPIGYVLNEPGKEKCRNYLMENQRLPRTKPTCGRNIVTWRLDEDTLPAGEVLSFVIMTENPLRTPLDNRFLLLHQDSAGDVYASRVIPGYAITPQLKQLSIDFTPPRMEAMGSSATIRFEFTSETPATALKIVGYVYSSDELLQLSRGEVVEPATFDWTNAQLGTPAEIEAAEGQTVSSLSTITFKNEKYIVLARNMPVNAVTSIVLSSVLNPGVPGPSSFDLITYNGPIDGPSSDERLGAKGPRILGYLNVLSSSSVVPSFFGYASAMATFYMKSSLRLEAGEILRVVHPPGYVLVPNSFRARKSIRAESHGLSPTSSNEYQIVLGADLDANTECTFSIMVDLPKEQEMIENWYIFSEKVNEDGTRTPTNTNDGLFAGFALVGSIEFDVNPGKRSPGASTELKLTFSVLAAQVATEKIELKLTGPLGFRFRPNCLWTADARFSKCIGYNTEATLVATSRTMVGKDLTVSLYVFNPAITPRPNTWRLSLFKDDRTKHNNYSEMDGYEVVPITVDYRVSNME